MQTDAIKDILMRRGLVSWDTPLTQESLQEILKSSPVDVKTAVDRLTTTPNTHTLGGQVITGLSSAPVEEYNTYNTPAVQPEVPATRGDTPSAPFEGNLELLKTLLTTFKLPEYTGSGSYAVDGVEYRCVIRVVRSPLGPAYEIGFWKTTSQYERGTFQSYDVFQGVDNLTLQEFCYYWDRVEGRPPTNQEVEASVFYSGDLDIFKKIYKQAMAALFISVAAISEST